VRFVADESCDFTVVRALRAAGHDVAAVAEISPRADDEQVLALAWTEQRILLTEDKDFGQLVHAGQPATAGVLLLRFRPRQRSGLVRAVMDLVERRGTDLAGRFVVVRPGRVRFGPRRGA
jgi:predicted nuclease of predicted toxin-antitoxin system